ncbi:hypothetical protein SAMN04515665_10646 [Blastococcus sp. DSM 46786]|uniref:hypothetical protein n=1 Tax=Blastococcus sp. DSM 46786 TaxID=1798227 RepID=UPI0008CEAA28|nr:hypothetical protein [Blastococcus sp. DSM 46786]SEK88859.1 hypothetical protein SAMN04515665_10646 [Blastococcus sp. DSM 46786]
MPADPRPRPVDGDATPQAPPSVRVAMALLATLAVLLLLYVTITWLGRDGVRQALTEAGLTAEEAQQFLLVNTTAPLVLGIAYAVSAWAVSGRRRWGLWAGVVSTVVLALVLLSTMLTAGGVTVVALLLLVLSVGAAASLVARTTRDWLAAGRA